ncbi:MAG: hypothetical protein AAGI03_01785, partial [Pseudomonadota bacterium]
IVTVAPHMGGLRTEPGSTPNLALTKPDEQTPSASKAAVQESVPPHIRCNGHNYAKCQQDNTGQCGGTLSLFWKLDLRSDFLDKSE